MRLPILDRYDEMLRRGGAVQRHGYEAGVETVVEGFAGRAEVGFDYGVVLYITDPMSDFGLIVICMRMGVSGV